LSKYGPKLPVRYLLLMLRSCSVIVWLVCVNLCTSGVCKDKCVLYLQNNVQLAYYKLNNRTDVYTQLLYWGKYSEYCVLLNNVRVEQAVVFGEQ
jgi:hypothetical protein